MKANARAQPDLHAVLRQRHPPNRKLMTPFLVSLINSSFYSLFFHDDMNPEDDIPMLCEGINNQISGMITDSARGIANK